MSSGSSRETALICGHVIFTESGVDPFFATPEYRTVVKGRTWRAIDPACGTQSTITQCRSTVQRRRVYGPTSVRVRAIGATAWYGVQVASRWIRLGSSWRRSTTASIRTCTGSPKSSDCGSIFAAAASS